MNKALPKVSVITIAYNQEKYIEQALKSIVGQKADFPFEVIVSDDASTDNTPSIIRQYAEKYPGVVKAKLRTKNVGPADNFFDALIEAQGEYIALCEGDDYWSDEEKLQVQVDFLEKNKDHNLCFHPVRVVYEDSDREDERFPDRDSDFTVKDLLKKNFIQTNSVVYRRKDYKGIARNIMPVDWYMHLFHAQSGRIGYIDRLMATYRRHESGIWRKNEDEPETIWKKYGFMQATMFSELLKLFKKEPEYLDTIYGNIFFLYSKLLGVDDNQKTNLFLKIVSAFPDEVGRFLAWQHNTIEDLDLKAKELPSLSSQLEEVNTRLNEVTLELEGIKASKLWKVRRAYDRLVGRK